MKEYQYAIAWLTLVVAFVIACVLFGGAAGLAVYFIFHSTATQAQIVTLSNVAGGFMAFPASYVAFRIVAGIMVKEVKREITTSMRSIF